MRATLRRLTDHASISPTRSPSCSMRCSASSISEQNNIIKLLSVMAVVPMPPTLIASVYGMNFKAMPESYRVERKATRTAGGDAAAHGGAALHVL